MVWSQRNMLKPTICTSVDVSQETIISGRCMGDSENNLEFETWFVFSVGSGKHLLCQSVVPFNWPKKVSPWLHNLLTRLTEQSVSDLMLSTDHSEKIMNHNKIWPRLHHLECKYNAMLTLCVYQEAKLNLISLPKIKVLIIFSSHQEIKT